MKKLIKNKCLLCGHDAIKNNTVNGYEYPEMYDVFNCGYCNYEFVNSGKKNLSDLYEKIYNNAEKVPGYSRYYRYFDNVKNNHAPLDYLVSEDSIYWSVKQTLNMYRPLNVLELGSGLGYLTYALRQQGYEAIGVDLSEQAVTRAIDRFGAYYYCSDVFEYLGKIERKFDLIIVNEVIEHVQNPVKLIEDLKCASPSSYILFTTPNKDIWRNYSWKTDNAPVHLHWFSKQSLTMVLEKLNLQFEFLNFSEYHKTYPLFIDFDKMSNNNADHIFKENGIVRMESNGRNSLKSIFYPLYYSVLRILGRDIFQADTEGKTIACIIKPTRD